MTEKDLITRFNSLKNNLKEVELNLKIESNPERLAEQARINEELNKLLEHFLQTDNTIFKLKISSVSSVFAAIIKSLKYNVNGLSLSLNQGMLFPNYLFFKIIQDINYSFNTETGGFPIPNLYYEIGSTFNHEELKQLMINIQSEFNSEQISNYPTLYNFVEKSVDSIIALSSKYQ